MQATDTFYESLLAMDTKLDCINYRQKYEGLVRNAEGIPLHLEEEVERRGSVFADTYENLYDNRKRAMRDAGIQVLQTVRTDEGKVASANFAACVTVPVFVQILEKGDGPLFAVLVLHWMRGNPEKEWVFSQLCEAVHLYFSVDSLRAELGETAEYPFDDLRDYLREALYQYNHRHC